MRSPLPSEMSRSEAPACAANNNSAARSGCWVARVQETASGAGSAWSITRRTEPSRVNSPLCSRPANTASIQDRRSGGIRPARTSASTSSTLSFAISRASWCAAAVAHPSIKSVAAGKLRTVVWFARQAVAQVGRERAIRWRRNPCSNEAELFKASTCPAPDRLVARAAKRRRQIDHRRRRGQSQQR